MYGLPGQASPFYGLSATHQGPPIYPPIPPSTFYPTGFSPVHTWWVTPLTIIAANPTTMMTTTTMIRRLYKCHSFVLPAVLLVLYTSGVDKCTCCMLYAVGCMLHIVCCMLHVVCCMLLLVGQQQSFFIIIVIRLFNSCERSQPGLHHCCHRNHHHHHRNQHHHHRNHQ